ncbi:MAG: glycyl-radical enzyme activating protein [Deltaproteobacteria bacterium]|nr:glycyl-radical enzyme activating protein [Deltaproteobacteria bacterium]
MRMDNAAGKRIVLNITRMTVHNGPGIRTIIQFKGCPLHCLWCSTPESRNPEPELIFSPNKCINCLECIPACPLHAISPTDGSVAIDRSACNDCGACAEVCNAAALKMLGKPMTVQKILEKVKKDRVFYKHSHGGVTLSGGEPLLEPAFNLRLLKALKEENITAGVDTCGHVPWDNIEPLLPYIDFFLWDLKLMDPKEHKKLTGVGNDLILENATRVAENTVPIYIRVPLVTGYTDSDENVKAICHFARNLVSVVEINLLPLHHLGRVRYEGLGITYPMEDMPLIPDERLKSLQELVQTCGLSCDIIG